MQRHIRNVEVKLQHPEAYITTQDDSDGETTTTVELHTDELHSHQQQHIIPVQHAYLQSYGNQQIIKVEPCWRVNKYFWLCDLIADKKYKRF
jgi:hypothetical protein